MYAGRTDAVALLGVASGLGATMPWVSQHPAGAVIAILAAASGTSWLTLKGLLEKNNPIKDKLRENFVLRSDEPLPAAMGSAGLRIGYTTDFHKPVDLSNDLATRHLAIVGSSGVGKTVLGEWILEQQCMRGGGWLFIDAKLDRSTRDRLWYIANAIGRGDEFFVINPDEPWNSNTYNPILWGDGDEVSARLLNLIPSTENNPGADHYKQTANQALTACINALKQVGMRYHFGDLSVLLQSPRALESLARIPDPNSGEGRSVRLFLDQYFVPTKEGMAIDMKKVKDAFGGIAGRISMFAQGGFGQVFNTTTPEVNLVDVIRNNQMLYVMLPTMGRDNSALNFAKMMVSDLRTAVAKLQDLPKSQRPNPPFICFLDEMGSYVMPGVARLFEQARSASVCLIPAFQTFANLSAVSPDFKEMVIQNTWSKAIFRFGSADAENASDLLGSSHEYAVSLSEGQSEGASSQFLRTAPTAQESGSQSQQKSYRQSETYRVKPDHIRSMGMGECILQIGARTYHIKTPMLKLPDDDDLPEYRAVRREVTLGKGEMNANFEARYTDYIANAGKAKPKEGGEGDRA